MTECNRKNRLLGKSIRKIRMRRNMTQRELANAIDGISEPKRRRKVRCTETGVVYESIKDAAERTKISPNGIGSAASGMAGGYHWEDGWSVTLTRYVSMELGETVASWVEFPNGWYLHSDDADAEFTQDGAKTYLQRLKSVWMESPFWDSVKAMEEKPQ